MTTPLGSFIPGSSPLHRTPAGAKLAGLIAFSVAIIASQQLLPPVPGALVAFAALGAALALAVSAGLRSRRLLRVLAGFGIAAVLIFAFQTWQHGPLRAATVVAGLVALILLASAVSASTSSDDMIDVITKSLRLLRRFGVRPSRVALTFSLAMRAIPDALRLAAETRDAARARGLGRSPRALLTPFAIRLVASAHRTGEALAARGIGDEDDEDL